MKRFGDGWNTRVVFELCATPVGEPCIRCSKPIKDGDLGVIMPFSGGTIDKPIESEVVYHRACLLDSMGISEEAQPSRQPRSS